MTLVLTPVCRWSGNDLSQKWHTTPTQAAAAPSLASLPPVALCLVDSLGRPLSLPPMSNNTATTTTAPQNNLSFSDAEMVSAPNANTTVFSSKTTGSGNSGTAGSGAGADFRTSFTADTPYYTSYVENEMSQLATLHETLLDISARAKTFGKCGALMAEATRRLSLACRLQPTNTSQSSGGNHNNSNGNNNNNSGGNGSDRETEQQHRQKIVQERREAVGEDMGVVLETLGEVCVRVCLCVLLFCH